jgi:hypothetical protein
MDTGTLAIIILGMTMAIVAVASGDAPDRYCSYTAIDAVYENCLAVSEASTQYGPGSSAARSMTRQAR